METENIKKWGIAFIAILVFILLSLIWILDLFGIRSSQLLEQAVETPNNNNEPMTRQEQRELLQDLAPKEQLTETQKQEQLDLLKQLQQPTPAPVAENTDTENTALDVLNSLNTQTSEDEQLQLLERLKN